MPKAVVKTRYRDVSFETLVEQCLSQTPELQIRPEFKEVWETLRGTEVEIEIPAIIDNPLYKVGCGVWFTTTDEDLSFMLCPHMIETEFDISESDLKKADRKGLW